MDNNGLLAPAAVLVLWTCIMLFWLATARMTAVKKSGPDLSKSPPGGRGQDIDPMLPQGARWASHNYTHLLEQPTIFYAVVLILTVGGGGADATNAALAWAYVGLRVVHSLWQVLVNTIPVRFLVFLVSSLCLTVLAVRAVMLTLA
jgi:uncharacterized MAPEG superfamily protein